MNSIKRVLSLFVLILFYFRIGIAFSQTLHISHPVVNHVVNNLFLLTAPDISYQTPQTYKVSTAIAPLSPKNTGGAVPLNHYGQVITFAGTGYAGMINSTGTNASFSGPLGLGADVNGNIYVGDYNNNLIRKITTAAVVTTFAGVPGQYGAKNGPAASATFELPQGVAVDKNGNVYVADSFDNLIRKITPGGVVSTLAGQVNIAGYADGTNATFNSPTGIAVDNSGNVYVADLGNNLIRKITVNGNVSTLAGIAGLSGATDGNSATFNAPSGVALDNSQNLFVADAGNNLIRMITPGGNVSTFAGSGKIGAQDGQGATASFNNPIAISSDFNGTLYVADEKNNIVREISAQGMVSTLAGNGNSGSTDGIAQNATFSYPGSIVADNMGNVYVGDISTFLIRKIAVTGYKIDKPLPAGLTFDQSTGIINGTPVVQSPSTDYTITAFNAAGSSSFVVNIQILEISVIFSPIPAKTVCDADFDPVATGGGPITYTSSNPAVATIVSGKIHITGAGTSDIVASDGTSQAPQTLTVIAALTPAITILPSSADDCQGNGVAFTAAIGNGGTNPSYQWQINEQNTGTSSPQFTSNSLKNGDIITCVLTSNAPCVTNTTAASNPAIFSVDPPISTSVKITSSANGPVCAGTAITFNAVAFSPDVNPFYQWQVNGVNIGTNQSTFTTTSLVDGNIVTCLLTSTGKCLVNPLVTSNAIVITLNPASQCIVTIPNAFTPNGDGINDLWDISALQSYPGCTISIYNRYGALVYNSVNYPKAWDGTLNGKQLAAGTYYYVIDLKNGKRPFAGSVTILR